MNKYDQERALCKANIKKCNEQIALWRKRKSEWTTRMNKADTDEKLNLISRSGYDDPDKLAEKLGVKRDEELENDSKKTDKSNNENAHNDNTSQSSQSSLTA